jgi:predicted GTPase
MTRAKDLNDTLISGSSKTLQRSIPNYDDLDARSVVELSRELSFDELLHVLAYEQKTKGRLTVLRSVQKQIVENPEKAKKRFRREAERGFSVLLVGQTGVGKSHTINSLFGQTVAAVNEFTAETKEVVPFAGEHHGVRYTIFDTPGLGEYQPNGRELDRKYLSMIKEKCSQPDILWLVMRLDNRRVRSSDANGFQLVQEYFGKQVWKRALIVFTHADKISS